MTFLSEISVHPANCLVMNVKLAELPVNCG